jgi:hypothetical protein
LRIILRKKIYTDFTSISLMIIKSPEFLFKRIFGKPLDAK